MLMNNDNDKIRNLKKVAAHLCSCCCCCLTIYILQYFHKFYLLLLSYEMRNKKKTKFSKFDSHAKFFAIEFHYYNSNVMFLLAILLLCTLYNNNEYI